VPRTILHADLDAFFASVEQLDNPRLRGKPVVVGGAPEARGVVAAASYEARRFGVHSAMPMSRALRLCPQAERLSPRFDRYAEVSRQVMAIFREVTPLVEPLSLDEAFLDASESVIGGAARGGPAELASRLKRRIKEETGLTVSIGVGTNKTVAKIASDRGKPDGLVVVAPGDEASFLAPMPVRSLWGVGPKAEEALAEMGISTIGELARADAAALAARFGVRGQWFHRTANGLDDQPVETEHERKSVGAETTFPRDLRDGEELRQILSTVAQDVARRLREKGLRARTVVLKLRYSDFRTITRQTRLAEGVDGAEQLAAAAAALLEKTARPDDRFRLLGIHGTSLQTGDDSASGEQLRLWQG
jgi:DNA polymerase-4